MGKIIAIHQPNFLPWLGYFHKLQNCDAFVLLDDVEYTKNSFINRNRIKTAAGASWLTLPIRYSQRSNQLISAVEIDQPERIVKKVLKTLETNYGKANNFSSVYADIAERLKSSDGNLCQLNRALIIWVMEQLELTTPIVLASSIDHQQFKSTARLIHICQSLEADGYLAGFGGKKYQDEEEFTNAGIAIKPTDFVHPVYDQLWGGFEPNLSVLDYLMNR